MFQIPSKLKCNKIIEIIDQNNQSTVLKTFSTATDYLCIPNLNLSCIHQTSKAGVLLQIRLDKSQMDPDLCQSDSVTCKLRIISDSETAASLIPDASKQEEFDRIIKSWQTSKNRSTEAKDARDNYLEKKQSEPFESKKDRIIISSINGNNDFYTATNQEHFSTQLEECEVQIKQSEEKIET